MARPAKAVVTKTGTITKEEEKARTNAEQKIRGGATKLKAPSYLTPRQKKVFKFIKDSLTESQILGNLDIYILANASICIDRMQTFEEEINKDTDLLQNSTFMSARDKYSKDFFRCCNELCLSPQARAKIAIGAAKAAEPKKKTLMDILNEEDDDK